MKTVNNERSQIDSTLTGAGLATCFLFVAFAALVTPLLAQSARRYSFAIASHSATLFQTSVWLVVALAAIGAAMFFLRYRVFRTSRGSALAGFLVLIIMMSLFTGYVWSVLTPTMQLERHMRALDTAGMSGKQTAGATPVE